MIESTEQRNDNKNNIEPTVADPLPMKPEQEPAQAQAPQSAGLPQKKQPKFK